MGSYPSKPSPETNPIAVQLSDTSAEKALPPCTLRRPPIAHKEWDECIRQSFLAVGSTTVTAIVVAMLVPAADTLLLIGTGAGVLWSVKRCRTLMRQGLLTPEEAKDAESKRRAEKEEKARQRKMEKEAKRKSEMEEKLLRKQSPLDSKKSQKETKIGHEQKAIPLERKSCKKPPRNDFVNSIKTLTSAQMPNQPNNNLVEGDSNLTVKSSGIRKQSKPMQPSDGNQIVTKDELSSVKLFAPHTRCTESVVLACNSLACTCNTDLNCTCPEKLPGDPEPIKVENQNALKGGVFEISVNVQQVNSTPENSAEAEDNEDLDNDGKEISTQMGNEDDSSSAENISSEKQDDGHSTTQEPQEDAGEIEVAVLSPLDVVEPPDIVEVMLETDEEMDVKIEHTGEGFNVQVVNNDDSEQVERLKPAEEVVFAEAHKSESWPFSFSLPSLDKFGKKKNNSFKWPPLTSSIIVKPKKEPKGSGGEKLKAEEDTDKVCQCGSHEDGCSCT